MTRWISVPLLAAFPLGVAVGTWLGLRAGAPLPVRHPGDAFEIHAERALWIVDNR